MAEFGPLAGTQMLGEPSINLLPEDIYGCFPLHFINYAEYLLLVKGMLAPCLQETQRGEREKS